MKRLEWALVKNPELNCDKCYQLYKESDVKPLCRQKGKSCPIEDVAPIVHINERVDKFQQYKLLQQTGTPEKMLVKILKEIELYNDYETLVRAELYFAQARNKELEKQSSKRGKKR